MARGLTPWSWGRPMARPERERDPFTSLQREVNEIFDNFLSGAGLPPNAAGGTAFLAPDIDVTEDDKEIKVSADMPGIEDKDIDVSLENGVLTIRGEKRTEKEEKEKRYHMMERSYGSFQRSIPVGADVDEDKVTAEFKNGVLSITLPKSEKAKEKSRRIPISGR